MLAAPGDWIVVALVDGGYDITPCWLMNGLNVRDGKVGKAELKTIN